MNLLSMNLPPRTTLANTRSRPGTTIDYYTWTDTEQIGAGLTNTQYYVTNEQTVQI